MANVCLTTPAISTLKIESTPMSPTSVSDFGARSKDAKQKSMQPKPAATVSDNALLQCTAASVATLAAVYNTPTLNSFFADFHWSPADARSNVWLPFTIVSVWAVVLWVIMKGPLSHLPEMRSKTFEVVHNAALTSFSITCVIGIVVAAVQRAGEDKGSVGLFCTSRGEDTMWDGPIGAWTYLYYLSKFWELADTLVLSFRKKPVIALQLWHHGVMPFVTLSWFASPWLEGAWWCVLVNSVIHSCMYFYYLQSCRGVRVWWKKHLTSLQIVQFCTGMGCCLFYALLKSQTVNLGQKAGCGGSVLGAGFSIFVNGSFLVMFAAFFVRTYLRKQQKNKGA